MQAATTETLREKLNRVVTELTAAGRPDSFYLSLQGSWNRYGSLTERQEAALVRSLDQFEERQARRAQENAAVTAPIPTGRVVISGEVLSTKYQDSRFGTQFKMLVKSDAGWKVWGTVPSGLACCGETLKGRRVTFTAAIESREPAFGFFSRPTNASVLNSKPGSGQQPEATAPVAPAPAAPVAAGRLADIIAKAKELEARKAQT
jgi:hypothetical protein